MSIDITVQVGSDVQVKELYTSLSRVWKVLFNVDHHLEIKIEESNSSNDCLIGPHKMALSVGDGENPRVQILISYLGPDAAYEADGHSDGGFYAVIYPYRYRKSFLLMVLVGIAFSEVFQRPIMDDANRLGLGTCYEGQKVFDLLRSYQAGNFDELTEKFCQAMNLNFGTETPPGS